jgi:hypothetical protein
LGETHLAGVVPLLEPQIARRVCTDSKVAVGRGRRAADDKFKRRGTRHGAEVEGVEIGAIEGHRRREARGRRQAAGRVIGDRGVVAFERCPGLATETFLEHQDHRPKTSPMRDLLQPWASSKKGFVPSHIMRQFPLQGLLNVAGTT